MPTFGPFVQVLAVTGSWFSSLASYALKDFSGKILGIWFPVMTFVVHRLSA
jgi:formate/nitrite transporter FocA (FNT family)